MWDMHSHIALGPAPSLTGGGAVTSGVAPLCASLRSAWASFAGWAGSDTSGAARVCVCVWGGYHVCLGDVCLYVLFVCLFVCLFVSFVVSFVKCARLRVCVVRAACGMSRGCPPPPPPPRSLLSLLLITGYAVSAGALGVIDSSHSTATGAALAGGAWESLRALPGIFFGFAVQVTAPPMRLCICPSPPPVYRYAFAHRRRRHRPFSFSFSHARPIRLCILPSQVTAFAVIRELKVPTHARMSSATAGAAASSARVWGNGM